MNLVYKALFPLGLAAALAGCVLPSIPTTQSEAYRQEIAARYQDFDKVLQRELQKTSSYQKRFSQLVWGLSRIAAKYSGKDIPAAVAEDVRRISNYADSKPGEKCGKYLENVHLANKEILAELDEGTEMTEESSEKLKAMIRFGEEQATKSGDCFAREEESIKPHLEGLQKIEIYLGSRPVA